MTPEQEIKLLKDTVRAQANVIMHYKLGQPCSPEWVFNALDKAKAVYGDDLLKIK